MVLGLAAVIIVLAGLIPKFSALLTTVPSCVLGGATVSVFAMIAMTGIKLVVKEGLNTRNTAVVGLSVRPGHRRNPGSRLLRTVPGMGENHFRNLSRSNRYPYCSDTESVAAKGSGLNRICSVSMHPV